MFATLFDPRSFGIHDIIIERDLLATDQAGTPS